MVRKILSQSLWPSPVIICLSLDRTLLFRTIIFSINAESIWASNSGGIGIRL